MFDWITGLLLAGGLAAVFWLMVLENVFPPIPAELVMPLAGFVAVQHHASLVPTIIAGALGSLLGGSGWYLLGRRLGLPRLLRWADRHGRWLTVDAAELLAAQRWFGRHGRAAVFLGRFVPGLRTFISVPAGLARMPLLPFLIASGLGSLGWIGFLAGAGALLYDRYADVQGWLNPVSNLVTLSALGFYLYRLATWRARPR